MTKQTDKLLSGRYKILKELGQGSICITYLAEDTLLSNLLCAIKKLAPQNTEIETAKIFFQREADILSYLQHNEQIPKFFDSFVEGQDYYLVQEYIEGKTLDQYFDSQWTKPRIINFLQEILSILHYIHHKNVIHCDINPSNIIRREEDKKFVLIDFGSIKQLNKKYLFSQHKSPKSVIETSGYAPPEQLVGRPGFNSDIYALGMTAIQLLTGVKPIDLNRDEQDNIIWTNEIVSDDVLTTILTKMVYVNPERRYQSVDDVLKDLEKIGPITEISKPGNRNNIKQPTTQKFKIWHILCGLTVVGASVVCLEFIHPLIRPLYYSYQGNYLLDIHQPKDALTQFQNLIAIQPDSATAWKGRGDALFSLSRYYGALEAYNKAISFRQSDIKALNNKGKVLYKLENYQEALNTHEQVIQIEPNNAEAWSGKGLAYMGLHQYQKALEHFEKAQKIKPDEPKVWLEEGLAVEAFNPNTAREYYQEALRCYDDLVKRNEKNSILWSDRGLILLKLDRPQEALESYQKALESDNHFYEALVGKGNVLHILGKYQDALSAFDQAIEIRPEDYQVWYNRGILLTQYLNNNQEALKSFDKALQQKDDFYPAWFNKGLVLLELKSYNEALIAFDKAKSIQPNDPYIWANRGGALAELGKLQEACTSYKKAIELGFLPQNLENVKHCEQ